MGIIKYLKKWKINDNQKYFNMWTDEVKKYDEII